MAAKIITGDDVSLSVQLRRNGATFVIDPGADVQAALRKGNTLLMTPVTCSGTAPGADWTTSLVVVEISGATTATLPCGSCDLEIQVDENNAKNTWITRGIEVEKGLIS